MYIRILFRKTVTLSLRFGGNITSDLRMTRNLTELKQRPLLSNPTCSATNSSTMSTILETSSNELQLSILEVLRVMKYINRNCKSKNNFAHYFFLTTPLDLVKKTILPTPTPLEFRNFFLLSIFFPFPSRLFRGSLSNVYFPCYKLYSHCQNSLKRSDRNKRSSLFKILEYFNRFQNISFYTHL